MHDYSDSDWAVSVDDMKSTLGYYFSFGSSMFSWCSRKQDNVAQSYLDKENTCRSAYESTGTNKDLC
jgi:hypothetical protein